MAAYPPLLVLQTLLPKVEQTLTTSAEEMMQSKLE
jgi:hypothetical protein